MNLTAIQLAEVTAGQFSGVSSLQIGAMGVDISSLSVAVVSTLSPEQATGLSNAQVSALGVKVGAFSASVMSSLTETQLSSIKPEAIALLSGIQLMAFNSRRLEIEALNSAAEPEKNAAQGGDLGRLDALTSGAQLMAFNSKRIESELEARAAALSNQRNPAQGSDVDQLDTQAIGAQSRAFASRRIEDALETQLEVFSQEQRAGLGEGLDLLSPAATQSGGLPRANEGDRAATALNLAPNLEGFVGLLSMDAVARMTGEQVDDLRFALSSAVQGSLNVLQFSTLSDRLVDSLSPDQISSLGVNIAALSVSATARLSAAQLNALTPVAIAGLTDLQLAAFSETQLSALSAASR